MTIEQIQASNKDMLTPADIAPVLGVDPYNITLQARADRIKGYSSFPFPVVIIGTRVKIPRAAFLQALGVSV